MARITIESNPARSWLPQRNVEQDVARHDGRAVAALRDRPLRVWLPHVEGRSGADVWTRTFATLLREAGHEAILTRFPHWMQYAPWLMRSAAGPDGADIVIGNSWNAWAFKRPGLPLVSIDHLFILDPNFDRYRSRLQSMFHNSVLRRSLVQSYGIADCTVGVSEYTARQARCVFPNAEIIAIPNGIDVRFFTPGPPKAALAGRKKRLLFVGNLTRRKGSDILAAIMEMLGDDHVLEYTSGLRANHVGHRHARMVPIGRLTPEQVRAAMQRADVLVLPTRLEGLPLTALEALACGTPVVASNVASLPEIVRDGINGYCCRVDDAGHFAAAIRRLTRSDAVLQTASAQARALAEGHLDARRMVSVYVSLARRLIAAQAAGATKSQAPQPVSGTARGVWSENPLAVPRDPLPATETELLPKVEASRAE